jgi:hypothetical protein
VISDLHGRGRFALPMNRDLLVKTVSSQRLDVGRILTLYAGQDSGLSALRGGSLFDADYQARFSAK